MKKYLLGLPIILMLVGCGGSGNQKNAADFSNFEPKTLGARKDKVLVQKDKNLMWINDADKSKKACLAVKNDTGYNIAQAFCENLTFAGFTDWRTPNSTEMVDFVEKTNKANIQTAYYAPCKLLMATDYTNPLVDPYGNVAVITRYGKKAGFGNIGDVAHVKYNIGLRCVRDN